MKLAIAGLCLLGILAAACAGVVVNGFLRIPTMLGNSPKAEDQSSEVIILYAQRSLPSMTVVDGSMVNTKVMKREDAPPGFITNPTDVVGKIISTALAGGQPFTKNCFADVSGPRQLAAVIPKGKRAVGISVTEYGGLDGLIYPGSIVDVMVSFRPADSGPNATHRDAVTTTLLQNIQVLAFEQQTVVSPGKVEGDEGRSRGARHVTLLVDSWQAKVLELAMEQGTLSLGLRNPLDGSEANRDSVSIRNIIGDPSGPESPDTPSIVKVGDPAGPHWDTLIVRGEKVETRSFPLPASKAETSRADEK